MSSSTKRAFCEQRLGLVEALGDERERDRRGEEHGPEPDHDAVFRRRTASSCCRGTSPSGSRDVRGEQEREEDRRDADQAADRALGEAEHEERHEVQEDEQVDRVDPAEECPEIHDAPSLRFPGPLRGGARLAARFARRKAIGASRDGPVRIRWSGAVRWARSGPDAGPDIGREPGDDRGRPPHRPPPRSASGRRRATSAGRRGSSRRRERAPAIDVEQGRRRAAAARRGARIAASTSPRRTLFGDDDREVALDDGMARRRAPCGHRRARHRRGPRPRARRPARAPRGARARRRSSGCSSPTRPTRSRRAGDDAGRTAGMQVRIVGQRRVRRRRRSPSRRQIELDDALGVVEVVRPGRPVPGRRLGGAGQREAEAPPLVASSPSSVAP